MIYLDAPMELGQTLSGKDSDGNLIHTDKLGMICEFPSFNPSGDNRGNKTRPAAGRTITAVLLRNTSGQSLYGKQLAQLSTTAGYAPVEEIVGYTIVKAHKNAVLIDPWLSSSGAVDDDICWCIIGGPAPVYLPLTGAQFAGGDVAVGDYLMSATVNSTSQATTSGRISNVSIANATDATGAFNQANAILGRALSAKTTRRCAAGRAPRCCATRA